MWTSKFLYLLAGFLYVTSGQIPDVVATPTFKNPIIADDHWAVDGAFIYLHTDGSYYYAQPDVTRMSIDVLKSTSLNDWTSTAVERTNVFNISDPYNSIFSAEIHFIKGGWYIYFHMKVNEDDFSYRNYVIKSSSDQPTGPYDHAIKLSPHDADTRAHRGTVLDYENGQLYFIWAGLDDELTTGNIYIAPMFSPTEIGGSRTLIRTPTAPWEGIHLGRPQVLKRGRRVFILFGALNNCLGIMGIDYKRHPLVAENWWHNRNGCVFWSNDAQNVFGPREVTFTTSPDYLESWMIYSASNSSSILYRNIRIERFDWDEMNVPVFPRPAGIAIEHFVPSGQRQYTS